VSCLHHARDLDEGWRAVAASLDTGADVVIDAEGRLHAAAVDAIAEPASPIDLRRRLEAMLPRVDIGELILEVMAWHPAFVQAFAAASGGQPRLKDLQVTIAAALTAHALNIGFGPVVSPGVPALTRGRISHVDQNYLRAENYAAANTPLIEAQADIALARALGGGLVAAVDGLRFIVPVRSVDARPNPRYFGRKRGATWLNMISDLGIGLSGKVVSGTPRDSLHLIDLIYRQDAGERPEVIISDTGTYSDIVFGLLRLLGFAYRPELADLPDAKLWRIDMRADYGPLNPAARGKIDLDRIRRHWPDIVRLVASIHTGASARTTSSGCSRRPATRRSSVTRSRTTDGSSRRCTSSRTSTTSPTAARSKPSATCRSAATTSRVTSFTAARACCARPTRRAWKTSSAHSASS